MARVIRVPAPWRPPPARAGRTGLAFHRLSRSVRQTAGLRIRPAADSERPGREAVARSETRARAVDDEQRRRRKVQVTQAVLAWVEREKPDFDPEGLEAQLEAALNTEALYEDFLTDDLDGQVAQVATAFGVAVPPRRAGRLARIGGSHGSGSQRTGSSADAGESPDGFDAALPYPPSR